MRRFSTGTCRRGLAALMAAALVPWLARAQSPSAAAGDPPALVGRIARVQGGVSSHQAGASEWEAASINQPVTTGTGVWSDQGALADVDTPDARIALDQGTELNVAELDERAMVVTVPQGAVLLRLDGTPIQGTQPDIQVQTPRGTVQVPGTSAGRYEVVAGDADHPTQVTVLDGTATITGQALQMQVAAGQTANISGSTTLAATLGPASEDAFVRAEAAWEQQQAAVGGPPQVRWMTGARALAGHGRWITAGRYGEVWEPDAPPSYVPYREGHWAWVAPWGWTWIDDAPWGFATSHYGRWVAWEDRWVWAPVVPEAPAQEVPVYAPAVVSFLDVGAAFAAGAAAGLAINQPTAWVPLAPGEPYVPPYRVSNAYIRNINVTNVTNSVTVINNRPPPSAFLDRRAATMVPAAVLARSQPVQAAAQPVSQAAFERARVVHAPPVRPGPATAGLTTAAARQLGVPPPARPKAPGPAIRPAPFTVRTAAPAAPTRPAPATLPALRATGGAPPPAPGAPVQPPPGPGPAVPRHAAPLTPHPEPSAPIHGPLAPAPANPATLRSHPEPQPGAAPPGPRPPHPAETASHAPPPQAAVHPAPPARRPPQPAPRVPPPAAAVHAAPPAPAPRPPAPAAPHAPPPAATHPPPPPPAATHAASPRPQAPPPRPQNQQHGQHPPP